MEFKKFDTINVIPFIDIMLVLLAIVLTTTSFIATGELDITLPEANTQTATQDPDIVEISINRDAELFFKREKIDLVGLKEQMRDVPKTAPITLSVDESVQFRHFVSVVDILRELSLDKLSIITRKPE